MLLPFTPDDFPDDVPVVLDGVTYLETPEKAAKLVASGQGRIEGMPELLTPDELDALRRDMAESSAWLRTYFQKNTSPKP